MVDARTVSATTRALLVVGLAAAGALAPADDARADVSPADDARERLEVALANESFKVRATAAVALGRLGDPAAAARLSKSVEQDDHYAVRAAAASALGRLGTPLGVPALLAALTDENPFVRAEAQEALERFHRVDALVAFEPALSSESPARRLAAVGAFGDALREGHDGAAPAILAALGDEDEDVRSSAQNALDRIPHERALPMLFAGLSHPDADVRARAADMLGRRADERAVKPLLGALSQLGERDEVRQAIRRSLRNHRAYIDVDATREAARASASVDERAAALRLLAALDEPDALALLEVAVRDPAPVIRTAASRALVDLGGAGARAALERAAKIESDARVKRQMDLAIRSMR